MTIPSKFEQVLELSIKKSIRNNYKDNLLEERHRKLARIFKKQLINYSARAAFFTGAHFLMRKKERTLIDCCKYLYERLDDEYSKSLLIQVLTYRLLGHRKVKLPLNDGRYIENIQQVKKSVVGGRGIYYH